MARFSDTRSISCRTLLALLVALSAMNTAAARKHPSPTAARIPPSPPSPSSPSSRRVVEIEIGYNRTFLLRMPTFLPLPANSTGGFVRSFNDTCGLFDISYAASSKAGSGPPPHVHYGDDEWFIQAGSGKVRMYTHQKAVQLTPGQLPGFNAPPVKMGSAVLTTGQALYSPRGSVHYFARETDTTDFYAIHVSGYAMPLIIDAFNSDRNATELLYYTGLYGAPHDMTGRFVGMGDCGDECYRTTVGPVDVGDLQLQRLQGLFDIAEERGCWTG